MTTPSKTLVDLETKFWQSMVDQDTAATLELLHDPCISVNAHGAMKLDHAGWVVQQLQGSVRILVNQRLPELCFQVDQCF